MPQLDIAFFVPQIFWLIVVFVMHITLFIIHYFLNRFFNQNLCFPPPTSFSKIWFYSLLL